MMKKTILAISGSLRKDSVSRKLLDAFGALAPKDIEFKVADISSLPVFNQDLELPEPEYLMKWKDQIRQADSILFVTPEHNRSVPAVLKNALDWASRPYGQSVWGGKPVAIAGCTPSSLGAFGAVHHLRQILAFLDMPTMQQPEFYLTFATDKFDEKGTLTDKSTAEHIQKFWTAYITWIETVNKKS